MFGSSLLNSEALARTFLSSTIDPIFAICAQDQRVVDANPSAASVARYKPEELRGLRLVDLFSSSEDNGLPEMIEAFQTSRSLHSREGYYLNRKDLPPLAVDISVASFNCQGKPIGIVTVRDIDDRKRLDPHAHYAQRLEGLGMLAGGIAHGFNNLLTIILGNAEIVRANLDPASTMGDRVQEIMDAVHSAVDLCQQLLACAGKSKTAMIAVKVNDILAELVKVASSTAIGTVRLQLTLSENLPTIQADPVLLRLALSHVVTNAIEALGPKGGVMAVSTTIFNANRQFLDQCLHGSSLPVGRYVSVDIADSGVGIEPAMLSRIFEPFFSTKSSCRGMGLAIVFGVLRGQRGAIRVESQVGKGTVFQLLFPIADDRTALLPPGPGKVIAPSNGATILVAEEDAGVRKLLRWVLENDGYTCLLAADGAEALEIYESHRDAIALVLMDLTMPRLGGDAAFRELVRLNPQVRVVLCTGFDARQSAEMLRAEGVRGILQKPYTPQQLLDCVHSVVHSESQAASD